MKRRTIWLLTSITTLISLSTLIALKSNGGGQSESAENGKSLGDTRFDVVGELSIASFAPLGSRKLVASVSSGEVLISVDDGESWANIGMVQVLQDWVSVNESEVWALHPRGFPSPDPSEVVRSIDGGRSFVRFHSEPGFKHLLRLLGTENSAVIALARHSATPRDRRSANQYWHIVRMSCSENSNSTEIISEPLVRGGGDQSPAFAIDAVMAGVAIYVLAGDAVFVSDLYGRPWESTAVNAQMIKCAFDSTSGLVWFIADGGATQEKSVNLLVATAGSLQLKLIANIPDVEVPTSLVAHAGKVAITHDNARDVIVVSQLSGQAGLAYVTRIQADVPIARARYDETGQLWCCSEHAIFVLAEDGTWLSRLKVR